jgi:hypothetical protein
MNRNDIYGITVVGRMKYFLKIHGGRQRLHGTLEGGGQKN